MLKASIKALVTAANWPGNDQCPVPARVVAEAETAEEFIDAVGSGLGDIFIEACERCLCDQPRTNPPVE